jgi:glycosyltransferase involved in cell wall biosynthesis
MTREVWFSPEGLLSQRTGGVSRYFCEIGRELGQDPTPAWNPSLHARIHGNRHLDDLAAESRTGRSRTRVVGRFLPLPGELRRVALAWSERRFLAALRTPPAIVHDTGHGFAASWAGPTPVVVTIHDLINDEDPAYQASRADALRKKAAAVAKARRIVVPSFATRDALVRVHRVDEQRIEVIHHGSRMPPPSDLDPLGTPYLLHVGSRSRYKDFGTAMRAYARLRRGGFDGVLVSVGGGSLRREERSTMESLGVPADSIRTIAADDRALATLYAHARALSVPSRIEGFGIPIIEAMSLGCPVACMDAPGCAEVAGGAALLAPIGDDEALAANLAKLIGSSAERSDLVTRGRARAARFTWSESARRHAACYDKALG